MLKTSRLGRAAVEEDLTLQHIVNVCKEELHMEPDVAKSCGRAFARNGHLVIREPFETRKDGDLTALGKEWTDGKIGKFFKTKHKTRLDLVSAVAINDEKAFKGTKGYYELDLAWTNLTDENTDEDKMGEKKEAKVATTKAATVSTPQAVVESEASKVFEAMREAGSDVDISIAPSSGMPHEGDTLATIFVDGFKLEFTFFTYEGDDDGGESSISVSATLSGGEKVDDNSVSGLADNIDSTLRNMGFSGSDSASWSKEFSAGGDGSFHEAATISADTLNKALQIIDSSILPAMSGPSLAKAKEKIETMRGRIQFAVENLGGLAARGEQGDLLKQYVSYISELDQKVRAGWFKEKPQTPAAAEQGVPVHASSIYCNVIDFLKTASDSPAAEVMETIEHSSPQEANEIFDMLQLEDVRGDKRELYTEISGCPNDLLNGVLEKVNPESLKDGEVKTGSKKTAQAFPPIPSYFDNREAARRFYSALQAMSVLIADDGSYYQVINVKVAGMGQVATIQDVFYPQVTFTINVYDLMAHTWKWISPWTIEVNPHLAPKSVQSIGDMLAIDSEEKVSVPEHWLVI